MLAFSGKSGQSGSPITVRALHDGKATINGEFERRPLDCTASHITVQGVNVKEGVDTTLVLRGNYCTAQRVVAWATESADGGIENICDLGGTNNLLEDSACMGYARKSIAAGARGGNGPNTIRRSYAEFNGSRYGSAQGNPTNPFEIGYGQNAVVAENVIVRRNVLSSATEPEAPIMAFSTHDSSLLGSIAFATAEDSIETHFMINIVPDAGSHAGEGHVTSRMLVQDLVLYAEQSHSNIRGMQIDGGNGSTGNVAKRIVAVAPQGAGACGGSGWSCSEIYGGTTLEAAMGGKNIWDTLPGICKRIVNKQITEQGLWPFPITTRVEEARAKARMPALNITSHVEARTGTIPEKCLSGTPPGPGPGPGPAVPVPPTAVTAVMQGTSVLIGWTDTVNTNQTGYVVERKVPPGGYDHLANVTGAATRSYTDASPVVGSQNCYVVYTRGVAGPSGFSPEACVQVPGAPVPPSGYVPLECQGAIEAGGRIIMQCVPQAGRR